MEKAKTLFLTHKIPSPRCYQVTAAKTCAPELENMSVGLAVVKKNFGELAPALIASAGSYQVFSLAGHQGLSFAVGEAAQRTYYYVVPIDSFSTLFIVRHSITENFLPGLDTIPAFLSSAEQKRLFDDILRTFTFGQRAF
jgi:hypothetical protein